MATARTNTRAKSRVGKGPDISKPFAVYFTQEEMISKE
jgi:hypothetical protein